LKQELKQPVRFAAAAMMVMALMLRGCERSGPEASKSTSVSAGASEGPSGSTGASPAFPAVAAMDETTLRQWAEKGLTVWQAKTCFMCHSVKGVPLTGPSPIGVWGSRQKLVDGREVVVDEAYIRESILEPAIAITAGYPNLMLPYKGIVTEEDLTALAALFRMLRDGPMQPAQPVQGTR
jgi:hypothetical protein